MNMKQQYYINVQKKIPIVEVPIDTIYKNHENSTSHFRTVLDSMRIYRELLKFVLSSASSFVLDYLMFGLFVFLFGKSAAEILAANICARIISAVYNFLMNTKLVFHEKTTCKAAGEYAVLAIGVLLLNNILLNGYIYLLRMNVFTAKIFTEGTLFIISFAVQKIWIFKHGKIKKNKILGT